MRHSGKISRIGHSYVILTAPLFCHFDRAQRAEKSQSPVKTSQLQPPKRTRRALARLVKRRECLQEVEFSTCSARRKLPPGANELKLCRNEIAACEGEFAVRAQRKNQFNNLAQNCSICAKSGAQPPKTHKACFSTACQKGRLQPREVGFRLNTTA